MAAAYLLASPAQAQTTPCADNPTYHQQDFALGDWDVFAGDKMDAHVRLEPVLAGCAIRESWTALSGKGNGIGLFTWSRVLNAWSYAWASNTGAATEFTGAATGERGMLYITQRPTATGGTRIRHWTLIEQPDHSIRELSVGSEDGGKTWTQEYELIWKKHTA
jgi:hypothetical protein